MQENIRLSKLMAGRGLCSRREADSLIEKGYVLVNGEVVDTLGIKVDPNAEVTLAKKGQEIKQSQVTILLNKPVGIVSCQAEKGYKPALSLITKDRQDKNDNKYFKNSYLSKLSVAGRLDINSKGLLILTQDGTLVKKLIGEGSNIEKEYFVRTKEKLNSDQLKKLSSPMSLDGKPLKKVVLKKKCDDSFFITLTEGRKRQIRRMCEMVDLTVIELRRVRIGKVCLKGLQTGTWRFLKARESFF